jgi:phosphate transport system substrate-binding protein
MNCDFRFLVLVYLVSVSAFNEHRAEAGVVLQGGGATFPYPLYAKWFAAFSEIDKGVDFNYQKGRIG